MTPFVKFPNDHTSTPPTPPWSSEHGGSRLSFLITVLVIALLGYAGSVYVPVAYRAKMFEDVMQSKVDQAAAFGYSGEWVNSQLRASSAENEVPRDAVISSRMVNGRMESIVTFTRPLAMPGFVYNYKFEHTARSSTFLSGTSTANR